MSQNTQKRVVSVETALGPVKVTFDPRRFIKLTIGYRSIVVPAERSGPIIEALSTAHGAESRFIEGVAFTMCDPTPDLKIEFVEGHYTVDNEEWRSYEDKRKVAEAARKAFDAANEAREAA